LAAIFSFGIGIRVLGGRGGLENGRAFPFWSASGNVSQNRSATRLKAGCFRFLTLSQWSQRLGR
jgi:hypothetical protein